MILFIVVVVVVVAGVEGRRRSGRGTRRQVLLDRDRCVALLLDKLVRTCVATIAEELGHCALCTILCGFFLFADVAQRYRGGRCGCSMCSRTNVRIVMILVGVIIFAIIIVVITFIRIEMIVVPHTTTGAAAAAATATPRVQQKRNVV